MIRGDLVLTTTGGELERVAIGLGDTARHHVPARIAHVEDVARGKGARDREHADGQERRPALCESTRGAVVDCERPVGGIAERDPELARGKIGSSIRRLKERAHALARRKANEGVLGRAGTDHAADTSRHEDAARADLGDHAARPHRGRRIARGVDDPGVDLLHAGDELCRGVERGVRGVETVDIRERHAEVRRDKAAHKGSQGIVVAKADLVDRNGIVLVHHGHHTELHQAREGVARMQVRGTAGGIVARE